MRVIDNARPLVTTWNGVRAHVMQGDAGTPPTGYHSKKLGGGANAEGVGPKNPPGVGDKGIYKQWIKARGQADNRPNKISTFFPDGWDEEKIMANVILSNAPGNGAMEAAKPLSSPGNATFFPTTTLTDPERP